MTSLEEDALYHLDLMLWVMTQPDIGKFKEVIGEAQTLRDTLARKRFTDG